VARNGSIGLVEPPAQVAAAAWPDAPREAAAGVVGNDTTASASMTMSVREPQAAFVKSARPCETEIRPDRRTAPGVCV
jgi:hypothetical protein